MIIMMVMIRMMMMVMIWMKIDKLNVDLFVFYSGLGMSKMFVTLWASKISIWDIEKVIIRIRKA